MSRYDHVEECRWSPARLSADAVKWGTQKTLDSFDPFASHKLSRDMIVASDGDIRTFTRTKESEGVIRYKILDVTTVWISWIWALVGNGSSLLTAFEEKIKREGYKTIQLETSLGNDETSETILRRFAFFQKMKYNFVSLERNDLPTVGTIFQFTREKKL